MTGHGRTRIADARGTNDNPSYSNHPGHYEALLAIYDPQLTNFSTMQECYLLNVDPTDGGFCDRGRA